MMLFKKVLSGLAISLVITANSYAANEYLLGDWAGLRPKMEQNGLAAEAVLTTDLLYNTRGGIRERGTMLGNVDVTFELDTAKAGWWENGTFFLYFLGNFNSGGPMTEIVGDVQASSNIEADEVFKLYEAWYEHHFDGDRLSFLVGLHDFNSEFDIVEYGALGKVATPSSDGGSAASGCV